MIGEAGRADTGAFLVRLLRLDPNALVRLRPARTGMPTGTAKPGGTGMPTGTAKPVSTAKPAELARTAEPMTEMWAMLPFGVLVLRTLPVSLDTDVTVRGGELLATLTDAAAAQPVRRDAQWHWPLPPSRGQAVETLPAADLVRVAQAASQTLREASMKGVGGRAVGERVIRDALLDHIAIVVTGYHGEHVEVPQKVIQAVVRMGFLGGTPADPSESVTFSGKSVTVRFVSGWLGLDASYGCAWYRPTSPMRMS